MAVTSQSKHNTGKDKNHHYCDNSDSSASKIKYHFMKGNLYKY